MKREKPTQQNIKSKIYFFTDADTNKKTAEAISGLGPAVSAASRRTLN